MYISTFGATKGYYQIPVKEDDIWFAAFMSEFGEFETMRTIFWDEIKRCNLYKGYPKNLATRAKNYSQLC